MLKPSSMSPRNTSRNHDSYVSDFRSDLREGLGTRGDQGRRRERSRKSVAVKSHFLTRRTLREERDLRWPRGRSWCRPRSQCPGEQGCVASAHCPFTARPRPAPGRESPSPGGKPTASSSLRARLPWEDGPERRRGTLRPSPWPPILRRGPGDCPAGAREASPAPAAGKLRLPEASPRSLAQLISYCSDPNLPMNKFAKCHF